MKLRWLILSLCGVVRDRLLQPLFRCSLTLLASSFFSESVVVVVVVVVVFSLSFTPLFHHAFFLFLIFGLLAISYPLVSLPD